MSSTIKIELPFDEVSPTDDDPKKIVIYSKPKTGKTELCSRLPNALLIDLEDGSSYVACKKINVLREAAKQGCTPLDYLSVLKDTIITAKRPFKYIIIDTVTALEEIALVLALRLYKATPMGANFNGINVLTLPNGAGYRYLRDAFEMLIDTFYDLCDRIILLGHIKDKNITNNDGKEVIANDIDLTGKIRNIVCSKADAIGYMTRENDQCFLNFKTSDTITCGARPKHLKNNKILVSEMKDGEYYSYWENVYQSM